MAAGMWLAPAPVPRGGRRLEGRRDRPNVFTGLEFSPLLANPPGSRNPGTPAMRLYGWTGPQRWGGRRAARASGRPRLSCPRKAFARSAATSPSAKSPVHAHAKAPRRNATAATAPHDRGGPEPLQHTDARCPARSVSRIKPSGSGARRTRQCGCRAHTHRAPVRLSPGQMSERRGAKMQGLSFSSVARTGCDCHCVLPTRADNPGARKVSTARRPLLALDYSQ